MEFLRFGSSIPGGYWGCCAVCIIQNFKMSPDAKASIEIVSGDGGSPMIQTIDGKSGAIYAGMTYREIFETRLRIGTFSSSDMPNHTFLAVLTEGQCSGGYGKEWMEILRANGFEFIRCVDNSVYTGQGMNTGHGSSHKNYIFGLFRNIGNGAVSDAFAPPPGWNALPDPYNGDQSKANVEAVQRQLWDKIGKAKFYNEDQLRAAGVPVTRAGRRKNDAAPVLLKEKAPTKAKADPFAATAVA